MMVTLRTKRQTYEHTRVLLPMPEKSEYFLTKNCFSVWGEGVGEDDPSERGGATTAVVWRPLQ